jgi:hypothetical protein
MIRKLDANTRPPAVTRQVQPTRVAIEMRETSSGVLEPDTAASHIVAREERRRSGSVIAHLEHEPGIRTSTCDR